MLKLPGRGNKRLKTRVFSPYERLFSNLMGSETGRKEIKKQVLAQRDISKKTFGAIRLHDVRKLFGKKNVLDGVNLEIKPGKILGIIGVSGSGKTTILRLIIGFYKPTSGFVIFNGENIRKQMKIINKNFGFATQDNSFYRDLTVEENVRFFGKLYGLTNEFLNANVDNTLDLVELYDSKRVVASKLSLGMQRRLDIACALIHDPTVLILDEPTEDLDPNLRAQLLNLIKEINKIGTTVIFTTHILDEAEYLCDEIAIISNGKILRVGSSNDLKKAYGYGDEIHLVLESGDYDVYTRKLRSFKPIVKDNKLIINVPAGGKSPKLLKMLLGMVEKNSDKVILADVRKPSLSEVFSNIIKNVKNNKKG